MYLAEDRIMCLGIHALGYDIKYLPDVESDIDPVTSFSFTWTKKKVDKRFLVCLQLCKKTLLLANILYFFGSNSLLYSCSNFTVGWSWPFLYHHEFDSYRSCQVICSSNFFGLFEYLKWLHFSWLCFGNIQSQICDLIDPRYN